MTEVKRFISHSRLKRRPFVIAMKVGGNDIKGIVEIIDWLSSREALSSKEGIIVQVLSCARFQLLRLEAPKTTDLLNATKRLSTSQRYEF